jgi:TPR repeat protein
MDDYSSSWSRSVGRSSDIPGSLLLTNAALLLIGAWATLGFSELPHEALDAAQRPSHPLVLEGYHDACQAGDAAACNDLAVSYRNGYGTAPDDAAATALFARACRMGSAESCSNQGAMLEQGWVSGADIEPVRALYARACDAGSAIGCSNLGALHTRGKGVPRNEALGRWLFARACLAGSFVGCENQGVLEDSARQRAAKTAAAARGL